MTKLYTRHRYPSLSEFTGAYNVTYYGGGCPVLQSRAGIPEFDHGEFYNDLYFGEEAWFKQLVPSSKRKPSDPLAAPPFFVIGDADDRTLRVEANHDYVTPEVIRRIQRELLGRHPLWRVILHLESKPCSIVIYPRAVRYGDAPRNVKPQAALRKLLARADTLREDRLRGERAEIAFLQQRLPEAMREIENHRFLPLGVLDNALDDQHDGRLTLLLLVRSKCSFEISVGPRRMGGEPIWSGSSYKVNAAGCILNPYDFPKTSRFFVNKYFVPRGYRGRLSIVDRGTGKRLWFVANAENIIHIGSGK